MFYKISNCFGKGKQSIFLGSYYSAQLICCVANICSIWWDCWLLSGPLDVIPSLTWYFFWKKPCPVDKPYPPVPWCCVVGCSVLVVSFLMVVIVGMIALVIHIMISVSRLDRYELFCLNKGNVFIFQVIFFLVFFFSWSDLNKPVNPCRCLHLESDVSRLVRGLLHTQTSLQGARTCSVICLRAPYAIKWHNSVN